MNIPIVVDSLDAPTSAILHAYWRRLAIYWGSDSQNAGDTRGKSGCVNSTIFDGRNDSLPYTPWMYPSRFF
jgi:hypothetical protein